MFKKVLHYGKPMSKFDIAYEIDRTRYSYTGLVVNTCSYEELRKKLYLVLFSYAPCRLCEFENLQ